jgi:hypothetical protein
VKAGRLVAAVLFVLAISGGCLRGWLEFERKGHDFDMASARYRAVLSAYLAISETQRSMLGAAPCPLGDGEAISGLVPLSR